MNWFQRFMTGRYGSDQLNFALLVLCLLLTLIAQISGLYILVFVSYLPLTFAIFRMFSRNINKRRAENAWFIETLDPCSDMVRTEVYNVAPVKAIPLFQVPLL